MSFTKRDFALVEKPWLVNIDHMGGLQLIYKFENEYGASVINTPFSSVNNVISIARQIESPTFWELAVIQFYGDGDRYEITYDTPITENVIGHLTAMDLEEILQEIKKLETEEEQ